MGPVAHVGEAGQRCAARGLAGEQPGGVRQQRGADAAVPAPQDDAGAAGPEAAVLEPAAVPDRPPQGSDALRHVGPEAARVELLGVPQADPGGIAGTTVRDERYVVRWSREGLPR